jgi:hypothetical protein
MFLPLSSSWKLYSGASLVALRVAKSYALKNRRARSVLLTASLVVDIVISTGKGISLARTSVVQGAEMSNANESVASDFFVFCINWIMKKPFLNVFNALSF